MASRRETLRVVNQLSNSMTMNGTSIAGRINSLGLMMISSLLERANSINTIPRTKSTMVHTGARI